VTESAEMQRELWRLANARVRQFQGTANAIAAICLAGSNLALWVSLATPLASLRMTLAFIAAGCGFGCIAMAVCRRWTRVSAAQAAHWLAALGMTEASAAADSVALGEDGPPMPLSRLWFRSVASVASVAMLATLTLVFISSLSE